MIDVSELEAFAEKCQAAAADLPGYAEETLDKAGEEFLDIVQAEIKSAGNVDTGALLGAASKGGAGNVYQLNGLTLTIGITLNYAQYVNDGHSQQPGRFVPGYWSGNHFQYSPGARSGMMLKASYVGGSHFWDKSEEAFQIEYPQLIQSAFEQFFERYF